MTDQRDPLHRHSGSLSVEETAACVDCPWADRERGARMRAGRHHRATGHRVTTEAKTTYGRAEPVVIPGQTNIYDFLEGEAA